MHDASHWFNRIDVGGQLFDVDLTGDQFGLWPVRAARAGELFPGTSDRDVRELDKESLRRAVLLAARGGLYSAEVTLVVRLRRASSSSCN